MLSTNIMIRKRITLLLLIAVGALIFLIFRLGYVQFFMGEQLRKGALENRMRDITVEAKRGSIFDRNGSELVTSVSVDSVVAIPPQIENPDETAAKVAAVLGMETDEVHALLTKRQSFVWIKRKVDYQQVRELEALNLKGIEFVEESKRYYLKDTLAAHIVGFAGVDNQGLTGIEKAYDDELRGIPGRMVMEYDAEGRKIADARHNFFPPVQGHNLMLTIDETVQYFVERELDKLVDVFKPKLAVIIAMNPKTGEIMAMGNRPSFDPNDWSGGPQSTWDRNPAIWYNYEPGSTFKIITLAAALEEKTVNKKDRFHDPGFIKVADRNIKCWKAGGHGSQSFQEVVENSCNPGFVKIGLDVGVAPYYKYIRGFGFGAPTGITLPGEARGITLAEKNVTNLNLACMSIGQSIAVTPLQLITAVAAVANGGQLVQPMLVKAITDCEGKVTKEFSPQVVRRVISEETSREISRLLESVVINGTGRNAYVEGYRTGGKTGTAQVVGTSGGYVAGRYVSSFVGYGPVDDPELVVLIMVAEPQGGVYYGSQVAAPTFGAVMRDSLRYLGIPEQKDLPKPKQLHFWESVEEPKETAVPQVVNLSLDDAVKELRGAGLNFMMHGEGSVVYGQVPEAGAGVLQGTTVVLELKAGPVGDKGEVTVPDLTGLTIKQVGGLLENLGLRLAPSGSGMAVGQSPKPGKKVAPGTLVKVEFTAGTKSQETAD